MMLETKDPFEAHPYFPSGQWEGFYVDYGEKSKMDCLLEFKNGRITGSGHDEVGSFLWQGTYELETETVSMTKIYLGQHSVSYSGHADENGIWGTWSLTWRTGGFHLWPKSLEEKNYQEEKEQVPIGWVQEVEII